MTDNPTPAPGIPAYDLPAPTRTPFDAECAVCGKPLDLYTPLRDPWAGRPAPSPHAACRAKVAAEREARVAAELAAATAEWERVRQRHGGSPALLAVLDLHRPVAGVYEYEVGCGECEQYDGTDDTEPATWPCETFAVIRDTPTG